jgi:hypothetical protein
MPPVEFEPTIPASERPQTNISERATAGIGTRAMTWNDSLHRAQQVNDAEGWGGGGGGEVTMC